MEATTAVIIFILSVMFYFLPTIVGCISRKINIWSIFILNLLLGWTIIAWIIALIWALNKDIKKELKPNGMV